MPDAKSKHTAKWDRCIKKVKEKSPDVNPYAICSSSIQDAGLKKQHQKRDKSGYYANRKRGLTKEQFITKFDHFVNERWSDDEEMVFKNKELEEQEFYEKAEELYNQFLNDKNSIKSLNYIKLWLEDNNEPEIFADYIFAKIMEVLNHRKRLMLNER